MKEFNLIPEALIAEACECYYSVCLQNKLCKHSVFYELTFYAFYYMQKAMKQSARTIMFKYQQQFE